MTQNFSRSERSVSGSKRGGASNSKRGGASNRQAATKTFQGDQNTTASQSHFLEEPIEPEVELDEGGDMAMREMMNQSAVPMNDYTDPMLERFMRS